MTVCQYYDSTDRFCQITFADLRTKNRTSEPKCLSLRAASALLAAWQSPSDEIASQKTLAMTSKIGLSELDEMDIVNKNNR